MTRPTFRRVALLIVLVLAAACGGSPEFDAKAPDVPFIDQYNPEGKDTSYDGSMNCGPAVLAGIAKSRGQTGGLEDADLINQMAQIAGTGEDGTSGYGMIAGLEWLGMQTGANAGGDLAWIDDELVAGHDVIANGDYYSVPGREQPGLHSGHYIAVTGVYDGWTVYEVTDPADGSVSSLTDAELQNFIESHPQGGFTLSAW